VPRPVLRRARKGGLQLELLAIICFRERIHTSRTWGEMITRPKMSRNEWKLTEKGASSWREKLPVFEFQVLRAQRGGDGGRLDAVAVLGRGRGAAPVDDPDEARGRGGAAGPRGRRRSGGRTRERRRERRRRPRRPAQGRAGPRRAELRPLPRPRVAHARVLAVGARETRRRALARFPERRRVGRDGRRRRRRAARGGGRRRAGAVFPRAGDAAGPAARRSRARGARIRRRIRSGRATAWPRGPARARSGPTPRRACRRRRARRAGRRRAPRRGARSGSGPTTRPSPWTRATTGGGPSATRARRPDLFDVRGAPGGSRGAMPPHPPPPPPLPPPTWPPRVTYPPRGQGD